MKYSIKYHTFSCKYALIGSSHIEYIINNYPNHNWAGDRPFFKARLSQVRTIFKCVKTGQHGDLIDGIINEI